MRTMGKGLVDIEAPQGFAAETSATAAILASSHLGFGLSTTHVASGAILGSGIGRRTEVRWSTATRMAIAWGLTLPAAGLLGAAFALLTGLGFGGVLLAALLLAGSAAGFVALSHRNQVTAGNVNTSREVTVMGAAR